MSLRVAMLAGHDLRRDARPRRCAAALARAGHRVTVYGVLAEGAEPEEDEGDVVLVRTPLSRSSGPWSERLAPLARAALSRGLPDVFHAVGIDALAPAAAAARTAGVSLVLDRPGDQAAEHELAELAREPAGLRGFMRRVRLRRRLREERQLAVRVRREGLAALVAGSATLAARMDESHAGPAPVVVRDCLPWAGPPGAQSLRVRVGAEPDRRLLVYRGRGGPASGLDAAIRALPVIGEHAVLVLLGWPSGDGEGGRRRELQRLEEVAARCGVGAQLRVLPPAPPDEMCGLLASADAALLPSSDTGVRGARIPGALFEYLAAGVPIVASDARGPGGRVGSDVGDIVRDTGAGVLFAAHRQPDPGAIAEAVHTLLSDEGLAATCRECALRAAGGDLSWETESGRLVTLYERLGSLFDAREEGSLGGTHLEAP